MLTPAILVVEDAAQQERLELHIQSASACLVLDQVGRFLCALPEDEWHHRGVAMMKPRTA